MSGWGAILGGLSGLALVLFGLPPILTQLGRPDLVLAFTSVKSRQNDADGKVWWIFGLQLTNTGNQVARHWQVKLESAAKHADGLLDLSPHNIGVSVHTELKGGRLVLYWRAEDDADVLPPLNPRELDCLVLMTASQRIVAAYTLSAQRLRHGSRGRVVVTRHGEPGKQAQLTVEIEPQARQPLWKRAAGLFRKRSDLGTSLDSR